MADEKEKKEGGEGGGEAAAAPAAGSSKKPLIIGGAVLAVLIAAGVPVYFFALKPEEKKEETELPADAATNSEAALVEEGEDETVDLNDGEDILGPLFPLEGFIVNLKDGRFLRVQIQVEFVGQDVPKKFYQFIVPIRDALITHMTSQAGADLENARGKETLKGSIRDLINEQLRAEEVKKVYFTQFVIQ